MEKRADALLIHVDALFNDGAGQSQIIALAGQHRLPTMTPGATFPAARRFDQLRCGHPRFEPAGRRLCRPYSARGKAGRLAGRAANEFRPAGQSQDRQGARTSIPESFSPLADEVIE